MEASLISYFGQPTHTDQFAEGLEWVKDSDKIISVIASDLHLENVSYLSIIYIDMKLQAFLAGFIASKNGANNANL